MEIVTNHHEEPAHDRAYGHRMSDAPNRSPSDDPLRDAVDHLVAELRDECSEVGISGRGLNLRGFERGVREFAREAKRLGATAERMLVLLKECLRDQRLPQRDRDTYQLYMDSAVRWAIDAYYADEG